MRPSSVIRALRPQAALQATPIVVRRSSRLRTRTRLLPGSRRASAGSGAGAIAGPLTVEPATGGVAASRSTGGAPPGLGGGGGGGGGWGSGLPAVVTTSRASARSPSGYVAWTRTACEPASMSGSDAVGPAASSKRPSSSRSQANVGLGGEAVACSATSSSGSGDCGVIAIAAVGMRARIQALSAAAPARA